MKITENKKGTIAYIGGFELPDKNAAAHRVIQNAKIFLDLGYKTVFFGIDKKIEADSESIEPIDFYYSCPKKYPSSRKEWVRSLFSFKSTKRLLDSIPDLAFVIVYNPHALQQKKIIRYCKKRKIKIISDITEWYDHAFSLNPVKLIQYIDTNLVMKRYHNKVDGAIVISDWLNDYYHDRIPCLIKLPPLVDINDEKWCHKIDNKQNTVSFIYSGSPGRNKDRLDIIVQAFCELDKKYNFVLKILGITEQEFLKKYPNLASLFYSKKAENKICFFGQVDHEYSISALMNTDYCIFFRKPIRSNMAGFPTKFVECKTCGCGLITNRFSDIEKYVDDNCILLECFENTSEIKNAIEHCIIMGRKKHNICDIFHYSNYTACVDTFLNKLINM